METFSCINCGRRCPVVHSRYKLHPNLHDLACACYCCTSVCCAAWIETCIWKDNVISQDVFHWFHSQPTRQALYVARG